MLEATAWLLRCFRTIHLAKIQVRLMVHLRFTTAPWFKNAAEFLIPV